MKSEASPLTLYRESKDITLAALGKLLGVDKSTVQRWESGACVISAERAVKIEKITGIPKRRLRPDLFGSVKERAA